jgi:hypothetical protein
MDIGQVAGAERVRKYGEEKMGDERKTKMKIKTNNCTTVRLDTGQEAGEE